MKSTHKRPLIFTVAALPYLNPPGERVSILYNGSTLYGNLRAPNGIKTPPVVILIMGLDSAKEEMFYNEQLFLDRGMLYFDLDQDKGKLNMIYPFALNMKTCSSSYRIYKDAKRFRCK